MKGDFTRDTFRPENHYSRVLQQQGRVSLDADWNEALDILTYHHRTALLDIIGPCCGPEGNAGFEITVDGANLRIGPGRYYAHGILCENAESHLFTEQTDRPGAELPTEPGTYLAYLDVWERLITALEDPVIREVALGGPDTATRVKVMPQVKLELVSANATCSDFGHGWQPDGVASTGQLAARAQPSDEEPNPCIVPPGAGYRRLENQLYRVEIHAPGPLGTATFKWSRENGSVVTEWVAQDGDVLTVASSGRDANLGFAPTNWIELTDDTRELQGRRGILVQLQNVEGRELTIDSTTIDDPDDPTATSVDINKFEPTRKVCRWESNGAQTVEIPAENDGFIALEGGVEVRFGPPGSVYQSGYWLIPARTNTGDVLWPTHEITNEPLAETRHGIAHHYCPLALLQLGEDGWTVLSDCRCLFPPLSDLPTDRGASCCTVTVGDGSLSTGDFNNIQEAVNALEGTGKICILAGTYQLSEPVVIDGGDVTISGCGRQTHIIAASQQPAFIARNGRVSFEALTVSAASPTGAIVLQNCSLSDVHDCLIRNLSQGPIPIGDSFMASRPVHHHILSHRLRLGAVSLEEPPQGPGPAIAVFDSQQVRIENNALLGLPAVQVQAVGVDVRRNVAGGGIWVWDGSAMVEIVDNKLQGLRGAGIVLGGVTQGDDLLPAAGGVSSVAIRGNGIMYMTDNGIGSLTEQDGISGLGDLEDITIEGNRIVACARGPVQALDGDGVGGIVLSNVSRLRITDNEILHNGPRGQPACGILLQECEECEVIDNLIVENGSPDIDPERCIDFRDRDDDADDQPLVIEGTTFQNINVEPNGAMYRIDSSAGVAAGSAGLQCHNGLVITFPDAVNTVSLLLLGSPITIQAMDSAGNVLVTKTDDGSQPLTAPRTLTITAVGMQRLRIEPMLRLWLLQICTGTAVGFQAGIAAPGVYGGRYELPQADFPLPTHVPGRAALVVHGNSVVCPAGQALWVLGIGPILVNDNNFTSRGEYTQPVPEGIDDNAGNTDYWLNLAQLGRCVSIVDLGIALELVNLVAGQVTGVRPNHLAGPAFVANPRAARQIPPGYVMCHDNQIICSVSPVEAGLVLPSVFLASFDDVSVHDNQIRSDIVRAMQITDIFVFGATVQVQANRLTEQLNTAYASCMSFGLVNNTSSNIATHCILTTGGTIIAQANHVINGAACADRQERVGTALLAPG